jgi:Family of unknown function (DUF6535)
MSVQDLRPRSRDDSAFYLQSIYQLLANPNAYDASNPPPFVVTPPAFSPPLYAVWVNSLWFLSLAISLTSALLATLLHQWTRRYVTIAQPIHGSPHKRARIRAFFANGVDKLHLPWVVETLPILLHLSLSLFLAGLLIFLFNANQTAFNAVAGWVALFGGIYACITFMPIFRHDSPFYAPLSSTAWFLYAATLYAVFGVLSFVRSGRGNFRDLKNRYREWVLGGVERAAEDIVSDQSSKVNDRVMEWTIGSLCEDDVTERFIEAIPGFCDSKGVQIPLSPLLRTKIQQVIDGFMDRTFSSESISESIKIGRLVICLNAAHAALGPDMVSEILNNIFEGRWPQTPKSIKMGNTLGRWCNSSNYRTALAARNIVASIIAQVQRRDERWIALVEDQFGFPARVLRGIIPYGDSVLLVILLHVTHNLFRSDDPLWDPNTLRVLSRFDIPSAIPQLRHEFCTLWNEIVQEANNTRPNNIPVSILREIHHLYIALHGGTHSPSTAFSASAAHDEDSLGDVLSYPPCNPSSHTSEPPPPAHTFAAPSAVVPQTGPASLHTSHLTGQNVPRFSAPHRGSTIPLPAGPSSSELLYAPHPFIRVAISSRPVSVESQALSITSLDIAAADLPEGNAGISTSPPVTHPIQRSESPDSSPLQSEELTVVSSPVVSGSTPPPIPSTVISGPNLMDIPSNVESTQQQSEDVPRGPSSPSPTASPQLATGLDSQITESIGTTAAQYDTHDVASSTPTEGFHRQHSLTLVNPDISESTTLSEDHQRDSSES